MSRNTCRVPSCNNEPGEQDRDDYRTRSFCSVVCELKWDDVRDDRPVRSEPADFGGGESTGVQDL